MGNYKIYGGTKLYGTVEIGGAKNGALPLLFATILTEEPCTLYGVPDIGDIRTGVEILRTMGATVEYYDRHTLKICTKDFTPDSMPLHLVGQMRASSYLLGACLGRFGRVEAPITGGCDFGNRPLDCHYGVFHAMGAIGEGALEAPKGLKGCYHVFPQVSVGATVNGLLAAARIEETVVLEGCATEPHVVDLERFLQCLGVEIQGQGTPRLTIRGKQKLRGTPYVVAPDDIEAGTYLCAVLATGGEVTVTQVTPFALRPFLDTLSRMGCQMEIGRDRVTVRRETPLLPTHVQTAPAPGFPTDLHPPLAAAMCFASGNSTIEETVWQHRFRYTKELEKMGGVFRINDRTLHITPTPLIGQEVTALDLRGGAALVVAALGAKGRSVISRCELLERGYEDLPRKLRGLGAHII